MRMSRYLPLMAGLLGTSLLAWTAQSTAAPAGTPQALVDAAYNAMGLGGEYQLDGGAQARDTLVTLVAKGSMQQWDPGESESVADLTKPDWGTATFTQMWDRSKQMYHTDWVRP